MVTVRFPDVTGRGVQAVGCGLAACWAAVFPLAAAGPNQTVWGALAAPSYALAGLLRLTLPRRAAAPAAAAVALIGAVLAPLVLLSVQERRQSEVMVVERSADLLVHTGVPYLAHPVLASDYNPYLPMMTLFGLPRAWLGNVGAAHLLAGDARVWFALVFLGCLLACGRLLGGRRSLLPLAALTASPLIALPLAVGGVDLPLIGLLALAPALAARGRSVPAGLVLALACTLKWTASQALPVLALLLHRRYGPRRAALGVATTLLASLAVLLPLALTHARVLGEQAVRFPLGLTTVPTPAGSPLPGKLLADLGPTGHAVSLGLLVLAALAVTLRTLTHPPATAVAAADRLAFGLTLAFLLAPAGRFGYLALPAVLVLWPRAASGSEADSHVERWDRQTISGEKGAA